MTWILFVILMDAQGYEVILDSMHTTMESCFEQRERVVEYLGEPIVNYQAVCARTDQIGEKI